MSMKNARDNRPYKISFGMVEGSDADCLVSNGGNIGLPIMAQGPMHGRLERENVGPIEQDDSHDRASNHTFRSIGLWAQKMNFLNRLKSILLGISKSDSCTIANATGSYKAQIEKTSSEIDQIEKKRVEIERRLDNLEATIDGDPKWFLKIERKIDRRKHDRYA